MLTIGLIREGKVPADNRVALTPSQCKWLMMHFTDVHVLAQSSPDRCFPDSEYERAGVAISEDMGACDLLLGIKEVPVKMLLPGKKYIFFSHTIKKQPHNQGLLSAMIDQKNTLIDYECLVHDDGQRIIGFGFFAGIVGAHNGIMAFGNRTGSFRLGRVGEVKDYRELIHTYFGLRLPSVKIAVTGSGRVAHGIVEIMNLMDIQEVEPDEYRSRNFSYPVYVQLKGGDLYRHKTTGNYNREDFHAHAEDYKCLFNEYTAHTDILMNGIYWDASVPRLFNMEDLQDPSFRIQTIADITDDTHGSVPCNLGDATIIDPVYGVDKISGAKTAPYLQGSIDMMAVGNLPNELPRDASRFFGEQMIKYILDDIRKGGSETIERATILKAGELTAGFEYLSDYAGITKI